MCLCKTEATDGALGTCNLSTQTLPQSMGTISQKLPLSGIQLPLQKLLFQNWHKFAGMLSSGRAQAPRQCQHPCQMPTPVWHCNKEHCREFQRPHVLAMFTSCCSSSRSDFMICELCEIGRNLKKTLLSVPNLQIFSNIIFMSSCHESL